MTNMDRNRDRGRLSGGYSGTGPMGYDIAPGDIMDRHYAALNGNVKQAGEC